MGSPNMAVRNTGRYRRWKLDSSSLPVMMLTMPENCLESVAITITVATSPRPIHPYIRLCGSMATGNFNYLVRIKARQALS